MKGMRCGRRPASEADGEIRFLHQTPAARLGFRARQCAAEGGVAAFGTSAHFARLGPSDAAGWPLERPGFAVLARSSKIAVMPTGQVSATCRGSGARDPERMLISMPLSLLMDATQPP